MKKEKKIPKAQSQNENGIEIVSIQNKNGNMCGINDLNPDKSPGNENSPGKENIKDSNGNPLGKSCFSDSSSMEENIQNFLEL